MKISVVIPTNRKSLAATARVLEAASLDAERFEVVVRDNSGDEAKCALLASVKSPALRAFTVPDRGAIENFTEAVRLATGDFIYLVGDDDWFSARGLEQLHTLLHATNEDSQFSCGTGDYLIETSTQSGIVRYANLGSNSSHERLTGFIDARAPNVLFYSAVRRPVALQCVAFLESLPYKLSYHDQLVSLIYLASGRIATLERVIYQYDLGTWESSGGTLAKDRTTYRAAGLPIEMDRLHFILCGVEGALLLKSQLLSGYRFERDRDARLWLAANFIHFRHVDREIEYSDGPVNTASRQMRDKWLGVAEPDPSELLLDVCDVLEVADKVGAERYFNFWSTL